MTERFEARAPWHTVTASYVRGLPKNTRGCQMAITIRDLALEDPSILARLDEFTEEQIKQVIERAVRYPHAKYNDPEGLRIAFLNTLMKGSKERYPTKRQMHKAAAMVWGRWVEYAKEFQTEELAWYLSEEVLKELLAPDYPTMDAIDTLSKGGGLG